jgi:hypothetical protein
MVKGTLQVIKDLYSWGDDSGQALFLM